MVVLRPLAAVIGAFNANQAPLTRGFFSKRHLRNTLSSARFFAKFPI
jgi:hypothetical protein